MTDSICAALAFNSTAMVGIATLTMKASTPNMNCAATTIASTHQRRELSTGVLTIWCMTEPSDFLNPESQAFVIRAITSQVRKRRSRHHFLVVPG